MLQTGTLDNRPSQPRSKRKSMLTLTRPKIGRPKENCCLYYYASRFERTMPANKNCIFLRSIFTRDYTVKTTSNLIRHGYVQKLFSTKSSQKVTRKTSENLVSQANVREPTNIQTAPTGIALNAVVQDTVKQKIVHWICANQLPPRSITNGSDNWLDLILHVTNQNISNVDWCFNFDYPTSPNRNLRPSGLYAPSP
jgi:hypothetical protein